MMPEKYFEMIMNENVDNEKVQKMEGLYGTALPVIIQKLISYAAETVFLSNGVRILSYDEIIDAGKDLHVDFIGKKILPVADCGENDFIVYHLVAGIWSKYNIIDEVAFSKKSDLMELLK